MKILSVVFVLLSMVAGVKAQNRSAASWHCYTGTHYGNVPAWSGWAREYAKDMTGFRYLLDDQLELDTTQLDKFISTLSTLDTNVAALELVGGMGSARDQEAFNSYMSYIEADSGRAYRDMIRLQSIRASRIPGRQDNIVWQIGNEISSPAYDRTMSIWNGEDSATVGTGTWFQEFIIPIYVEYFLAPTVEAIDSGSVLRYGTRGKIDIGLGSVTNAHSEASHQWLDSLMHYTVQGQFAPGLAGKKVYELIHLITVHYMMGVAATATWQSTVDDIWKWVGTGRVRGLMSTEEVGIKAANAGRGAVSGALNTARYLAYAIRHDVGPEDIRTNYYGWNTGPSGTTVNDFNTALYDFLGPTVISEVDLNAILLDKSGLEPYGFYNADSTKCVFFVSGARGGKNAQSVPVAALSLAPEVMGNQCSIRGYYYSTEGSETFNVDGQITGDSLSAVFPGSYAVGDSGVLLLCLTKTGGTGMIEAGADTRLYIPETYSPWFSITGAEATGRGKGLRLRVVKQGYDIRVEKYLNVSR